MLTTAEQAPIPFVAGRLAPHRVFIADDHALYRQVLVRAVECHPDLALAGQAPDGETALTSILETMPDVALLDMRMPGLDGLEVCRRLRAIEPGIAVVILTAFDDETTPARARTAGATACLGKDAAEIEICKALLRAGDCGSPSLPPPA